jgi:hypothetical protein
MRWRLLALALAVGLLGLPVAPTARASEMDTTTLDAIIVVAESDLSALLESGVLEEYSFISASEVGLDPADLAGALRFGEDSLLTPQELGLDNPAWGFFGPRFNPFFTGFRTIGVPVFVPRVVPVAVPVPVAIPAPFAVPVPVYRPVLVYRPVFAPPPLLFPRFPAPFFGRVIVVRGF